MNGREAGLVKTGTDEEGLCLASKRCTGRLDIKTKKAISGVVRKPDLSQVGSPHFWLLLGATTNIVRDSNLW